jgi:hypothetical protein
MSDATQSVFTYSASDAAAEASGGELAITPLPNGPCCCSGR